MKAAVRIRRGVLCILLVLQFVTFESASFLLPTSVIQTNHCASQCSSRPPTSLNGKGDGKKKRKKKSATADSPTVAAAASPPPQRVTTEINVPVKRQIMWANFKKEQLKKSGLSFRQTNAKRTRYRKSIDEEEQEVAKIERKKRGQEPEWDVILNATATSPLVLVDAYNVIYQWPRLKKWMIKGDLKRARDLLLADLEDLHGLKGWRIECVFDGFGRSLTGPLGDGPGGASEKERIPLSERQTNRVETGTGMRVVYSGVGASADSYIESRCLEAKSVTKGKLTGSLIVVSNDAMVRVAATGAGALCMSSDRLVDELKAVKKATEYRVEVALAIVNGVGVRPEQLRGKSQLNTLSGGNQFIIEDKRKKKETKTNEATAPKRAELKDLKEGTKVIPSWAQVPEKE